MDWQSLSQKALDAAYNQAVYAPNMPEVLARLSRQSQDARKTLGLPRRLVYGAKVVEGIDFYPSSNLQNPTLIFIHGGSWQVGHAEENAFAAPAIVNAGFHFAVPDFSPVDDFGGDLRGMIKQLKATVAYLYRYMQDQDGNPHDFFLCGFSSGAHLAGVLLTEDWSDLGINEYPFKGALLCSGMYELTPVSRSFRREFVTLNESNIAALSPQHNLDKILCPVSVAYGTDESPEFQRQGCEFIEALKSKGKHVTGLVAKGLNHFEIIETLGSMDSKLFKLLLDLKT